MCCATVLVPGVPWASGPVIQIRKLGTCGTPQGGSPGSRGPGSAAGALGAGAWSACRGRAAHSYPLAAQRKPDFTILIQIELNAE